MSALLHVLTVPSSAYKVTSHGGRSNIVFARSVDATWAPTVVLYAQFYSGGKLRLVLFFESQPSSEFGIVNRHDELCGWFPIRRPKECATRHQEFSVACTVHAIAGSTAPSAVEDRSDPEVAVLDCSLSGDETLLGVISSTRVHVRACCGEHGALVASGEQLDRGVVIQLRVPADEPCTSYVRAIRILVQGERLERVT